MTACCSPGLRGGPPGVPKPLLLHLLACRPEEARATASGSSPPRLSTCRASGLGPDPDEVVGVAADDGQGRDIGDLVGGGVRRRTGRAGRGGRGGSEGTPVPRRSRGWRFPSGRCW